MYPLAPCPPDYPLPFSALIVAAWLLLAIIGLEALLALATLLVARSRAHLALALALLLGAPVALGLIASLQRQNLALCLVAGDIHYTPALGLRLHAYYAQLVAHASVQADATFCAIVAIALLGALIPLAERRARHRCAALAQ